VEVEVEDGIEVKVVEVKVVEVKVVEVGREEELMDWELL